MPLTRVLRPASPAALASCALVAFLAACADSPTTPGASASQPLFGTTLSRTHPVGGAMSTHAPTGDMPAGLTAFLAGPLSGAPTVAGVAARPVGDASAPAVRVAPDGLQQPEAVVLGSHLVWQNTSTGERSIWTMTGATWGGTYTMLQTVPTQWQIAAAADFTGDGQPDLVWQNIATGERSIWTMNGQTWGGAFVMLPVVPTNWRIAGAGDFNADGKADLVWQDVVNGDRSIWFMNGTTWNNTYALLPNQPVAWQIAAVDDFNADNKPDLVWQNTQTGLRSIWFMNGSVWQNQYALLGTVATQWSIKAAADFNSDGFSDLVWQNAATGERSIWLMAGSTWNGQYSALPTITPAWSIAAAGNFATNGAPTAVTNVAPTSFPSASATSITLNWTRTASRNETESRIDRVTWAESQNSTPQNPIQWVQVGTVGAGVTTFTDNNGLAAATRYFYRVRSCNAAGCSGTGGATAAAETAPSTITTLTAGVSSVATSASQGTSKWYQITIPAGHATLVVSSTGGTGESDIYVTYNALNATTFACTSALNGPTESCTVNNPAAGTYYIRLFGRNSFANVSVKAN